MKKCDLSTWIMSHPTQISHLFAWFSLSVQLFLTRETLGIQPQSRCCGITDIRAVHLIVFHSPPPSTLLSWPRLFRPCGCLGIFFFPFDARDILNWIEICRIKRPLSKASCARVGSWQIWNKYPITLTFPNSTRSCLSLILSQKAYNKLCTVGFRSGISNIHAVILFYRALCIAYFTQQGLDQWDFTR